MDVVHSSFCGYIMQGMPNFNLGILKEWVSTFTHSVLVRNSLLYPQHSRWQEAMYSPANSPTECISTTVSFSQVNNSVPLPSKLHRHVSCRNLCSWWYAVKSLRSTWLHCSSSSLYHACKFCQGHSDMNLPKPWMEVLWLWLVLQDNPIWQSHLCNNVIKKSVNLITYILAWVIGWHSSVQGAWIV